MCQNLNVPHKRIACVILRLLRNGVRIHRSLLRVNDIVRSGSSPPTATTARDWRWSAARSGCPLIFAALSAVRSGLAILENVTISIAANSSCAAGAERDGEERPAELSWHDIGADSWAN